MENNTKGITTMPLRDIWFVFWNNKWLFAILTAIGTAAGCIAMLVTQMQNDTNPKYVTTAAIAVVSENRQGTYSNGAENPNSNEIYLAENLADAVIYVAKSNIVLNTVINNMELLGVNAKSLSSALDFSQYEESQIIRIELIWSNQDEGVKIVGEIVNVLPDILIQTLKLGSVEVVDMPESHQYSNDASVWNILIGFTIGLAVAVFYCIAVIILRPAFYSTEYLSFCMHVPVIGEILHEKMIKNIKHGELLTEGEQLLSGKFLECCSACAYTLRHQLEESGNNIVYVTSTASGEGKTATVAMLGRQLSLQKKKVLLVDFDVRQPSLCKYFLNSFDKYKSLNAVVRGKTSIDDAIISLSENLDILPTYLESKKRHISDFTLEPLRKKMETYDCVLIDTSPVGLVSDALYLNQITNQVLMVVRQGAVWQEVVLGSKEELLKNGAEIIGCVFNAISTKTPITRYYYRNYGYDYSYNDEKGKHEHDKSKETVRS